MYGTWQKHQQVMERRKGPTINMSTRGNLRAERNKPWPHSPAVIARVEVYAESGAGSFPEPLNSYYEVDAPDGYAAAAWTHEKAVELARYMKRYEPALLGFGPGDNELHQGV